MTLDELAVCFPHAKKTQTGYEAPCPVHKGQKRMLVISQRNGQSSLFCKYGCEVREILAAVGLPLDALSANGNGAKAQQAPPQPSPQPQQAPPSTFAPKQYNTTDMGNAERFVDMHGAVIRYCSQLGKDGQWLVWDGKRWKLDHNLHVHTLAKQVVPSIYTDAGQAATKQDKKRLFNWAVRTEGLAARGNMIKDARHMVAISVTELDQHPWLLNVKNGTLDLKTGILAPHTQDHKITKLSNVDFNDQAECPAWMEFLTDCMNGNAELVSYLQKIIGYSLTGDVSEKCVFVLHGPKDTGKTTFIETIRALIDEYAAKIQTQTLMWQRDRSQTNDVARLKGARFVYACESEENERLAESRLKEMSGGDTLVARFLHAEFFQFDPEFKIFLATNNKPKVSNDEATWGRLKLIPFTHVVIKKDKDLKNKFRAELPGILRWAVDGCLIWQRQGLTHPDQVTAATKDYRTQMDVIGMFIDECMEIGEFFRVASRTLYEAYKTWCVDNGEKIESQRVLGLRLKDRGLTNEKATAGTMKGRTEWIGIKLK